MPKGVPNLRKADKLKWLHAAGGVGVTAAGIFLHVAGAAVPPYVTVAVGAAYAIANAIAAMRARKAASRRPTSGQAN